jgi:hypothetical protein
LIQDAFVSEKQKNKTKQRTFHFKFSIVCAKRSLITTMEGAATISISKKVQEHEGKHKRKKRLKTIFKVILRVLDLFSLPSKLPGGE